jgi:hypothetical protein
MTWTSASTVNSKIGRRFRDLSVETKMLAIILPLVAIPMILLGTVGYLASSGQATASGARYLAERRSDLHKIAENPSIRDYFDNRSIAASSSIRCCASPTG